MKNFLSFYLMVLSIAGYSVDLKFKFDVQSSGPSIYACNAGIKKEANSGVICYDKVTLLSCQPGDCQTAKECNCTCTGSTGQVRHDGLSASYATWTDNAMAPLDNFSKNLMGRNSVSFTELFSANNEWLYQLTNLSFKLTSETYGTEYFLDICYRGPQVDYDTENQQWDTFPNYLLTSSVTLTDLSNGNGQGYASVSGLKTKVVVTCDVQGEGQYQSAADNNGEYNNPLAHEIIGVTGGTVNFESPWVSFGEGTHQRLLTEWINQSTTHTPRFCKVRYYFKEAISEIETLLAPIRKWEQTSAQFCTYTEIEEDVR